METGEIREQAADPGRPQVLACPACGGAITLRAAGHSINVVCGHCGSLLDVAREEVSILQKARAQVRETPIPLGSRGQFEGQPWEVIGYQERCTGFDQGERYEWDEYLLFNPRHGFRFLAQDHGHWTLFQVVKAGLGLPDNLRFDRFFSGQARVEYVVGEFYWRVKKGDKVRVTDSIAPPYVMSVEEDKDETSMALGRYLPAAQVAGAFGLDPAKLPKPKGIAPNQPSPFAVRVPGVLKATLIAGLVATGTQFVQAYQAKNQLVHATTFEATRANRQEPQVSPPFDLPQEQANLCLETWAQLNNNWADLTAILVDETSGARLALNQSMEFYSGSDGGERWSEGNTTAEDCFPAVPGGRYRLLLVSDAGVYQWGGNAQTFGVRTFRDAPIWSNWLALLLALLPYPLYLWLRHHSFEYSRWSESDFMPATYAGIKQSLSSDDE